MEVELEGIPNPDIAAVVIVEVVAGTPRGNARGVAEVGVAPKLKPGVVVALVAN